MTVANVFLTLWKHEQGQDLIEYSLLIAFITFATASLFLIGTSGNTKHIWETSNSQLTAANTAAS